MSISSELYSAISCLAQSADRAGKTVQKVVTADLPKKEKAQSALDVQDTV